MLLQEELQARRLCCSALGASSRISWQKSAAVDQPLQLKGSSAGLAPLCPPPIPDLAHYGLPGKQAGSATGDSHLRHRRHEPTRAVNRNVATFRFKRYPNQTASLAGKSSDKACPFWNCGIWSGCEREPQTYLSHTSGEFAASGLVPTD